MRSVWRVALFSLGVLLWGQSLAEAEQALSRENYDRVLALTQQILNAKPKELYAYWVWRSGFAA